MQQRVFQLFILLNLAIKSKQNQTLDNSQFDMKTYLCMMLFTQEQQFVNEQFEKFQQLNRSIIQENTKSIYQNRYSLACFNKCYKFFENTSNEQIYDKYQENIYNDKKSFQGYIFELSQFDEKKVLDNNETFQEHMEQINYINNAKKVTQKILSKNIKKTLVLMMDQIQFYILKMERFYFSQQYHSQFSYTLQVRQKVFAMNYHYADTPDRKFKNILDQTIELLEQNKENQSKKKK